MSWKALQIFILLGLWALSACDTDSNVAMRHAALPSTRSSQAAPVLAPAISQLPAAGVCPLRTGNIITIAVNVDTPSPRCVKAIASQRLQITNTTSAVVEVQFAQFQAQIPPGQSHLFDQPLGTYLAPGVHGVSMSTYHGSGAEIWLISTQEQQTDSTPAVRAETASIVAVPTEDSSSTANESLYHITAQDSGKTFTYTLTSRFVVTLDERAYPQPNLKCEPSGIIGRITNVPSAEPPLYNEQFEAVTAGTCILRDGSFKVTIHAINQPEQ